MSGIHFLCQFSALFIHCLGPPNTRKPWRPFTPLPTWRGPFTRPQSDPWPTFDGVPWVAAIDDTCVGILLSPWWILSAVTCLTRLKHLTSDFPKAIHEDGVSRGDEICLHPGINPGRGKCKGHDVIVHDVIRVSRLRVQEISLPPSYVIVGKSCLNRLCSHCGVYQSQKYSSFENNIKKLSIEFLDISFCHHQHNCMHESNKLCIWIHQKENCLIQQGSPVLCIFGSHWEVMGLTSKSSRTCDDPILVIKMAPNRSWMRQFIKRDKKPLDSIFPLLCNFCPGIEGSQNNNISSVAFVPHGFSSHSWSRLITSSQSRPWRNPPPFLFVSNNKDSFAGRQLLYFQDGCIFSASKFLTSRPWTIPMFKTLGIYHSAASCNNQLSSHFDCFSHCETLIPRKACMSSSFPWRNALQYQNGKLAGSGRYRTDLSGAITRFHTISINSIGSLIPLSKQIDGFQISSEIYSLYPQTKPRMFSSPDQCVVGSWLGVSPDIRSGAQTQAVPYETETVIWSPFNKEFGQMQIYYIVEKVTISANEETYDVTLWSPLLVSEIKLSTHPMLNGCGYQYSSATPKVNTLFSGAWYSVKSQITSTEPDAKTMSPVSKTNLLSYTITIPFSRLLPTDNPFLSWAYYKPNKSVESSHLHTVSLLNTHEASVLKQQKRFEDISWPLFHSNIVKPLTYFKINYKRQWIQSDSDIPQLWTFSKIEPRKYLDTLKADKTRLWLQIKNKETKFQKHPKFPFESPRIESREGKIKYWMKARGGTIISLDQTETRTIGPRNRPDPSAVEYCSNSCHTLLRMQRDVKTLQLFTYLEIVTARPLGSPTGNIEHSEKSEPFTVRSWVHAEGVKITHWTKSHTEENNVVWFPVQSRGAQHPCDSQVNRYLSKMQDEKIQPWYRPQVSTFKTVINTEFPMLPSWNKHEGDQSGLWTQSQDAFAKYWSRIRMKTISQGAQPISQTEHKWAVLETETRRLWDPPVVSKLRNWIHHGIDTVKTLNNLDVHIIKPWVHREARTLVKWRQTDSLKLKTQAPYEADIAMSWNREPLVHDWKDFLEDRDTTWINSPLQELNDWAPPKINRSTRWVKTDMPLSSTLIVSEMDTFVQSAISKSSNINLLIDSIIYAMLLWTKKKPASKSKCTHTMLILWMSTKMLAGSLCVQVLQDKPIPWLQDESQETNNWVISESDLTSLWPKTHYPEINSSVQFKGETLTIWDPEEYPTLNLWREIEAEITTELTHTESPLGTSCAFQVTDMTVFNQADPPSGIRLLREDCDEITWLSYETQPVNLWTLPGRNSASTPHYETSGNNFFSETKYDTDIPWFHTEFFTEISLTGGETASGVGVDDAETVNMWTQTTDALEKLWPKDKIQIATSSTERRTDSFTSWIQMESPTYDKWTLHVSDKITLLTQAIHPTGYQWMESVAPTAPVWLEASPLLVNLWLQKVPDRAILPWPQAQYPPLNLQLPAVTYTILPNLLQTEYAPISLWRKPASDVVIVPWNQPELFNQKTYLESNTRMPPWPEAEQIPEHLWLLSISDTLIPQWLWHTSSKINMASAVNSDALIMSIPRWPEKHTSEVNLRSLLVSDRKATAWLWSEYSAGNVPVSPMDDHVTSWSQSQSLPVYAQAWTVFDTMVQSHTHNKYTLINQWPPIFSGAMTSPWCLDDFQVTSVWGRPVSDELTLSCTPASSPEVNPWGSVMSDTITDSCSGSGYLLVDSGTLLRYNKIPSMWLQQRLPLDIRLSPVSDIIAPHRLQKESAEGILRPWSASDAVSLTWTQIESPIWSLWALLPPNPGSPNVFPTRNLLPNYSADRITQPWNHTETPWISHASVTIPPLRQTEFRAENLWTLPLSDIVAPLSTLVGSLPLYPRTPLPSNFITPLWTLPEPLPSKLWISPVLNGLRLSLPQTESKSINAQTLFDADPLILPWTQSKHETLTPWADDMLSQSMASEVLSVRSQIQSASDPDQNHLQIPATKHWMYAVPDHVFLRNLDSSPAMYFWKKDGIDTFMEWASSQFTNTRHPTETLPTILNHDEITTTDSWTNFETNIVPQMSQANSSILNLWTHVFAHWTQSNFDGVTPWAQTLWAVESPTIHMHSTEPLWKLAHTKLIKSWKQPTTEMALQMITEKSTTVYSFTKFVLDNAFISDHSVSPIGSRQAQTEADEVIWTQSKSLKNYIQTNPYSKIFTKWGQSDFSEDIIWTEPGAGKATVWQQSKSKYFIPRIGEIANVVKARAETESSVKSYFAKLVANSLTAQIQANFLAMNVDAQPIHDKFILRTNANYPLTKSWRKEENRAVNTKGISENYLLPPVTEIINLCTDMVYPTFNSLLQIENVATVWSQVEPQQTKFPWEKTKLSNIIHWTQSDSLSIYPSMNNKLSELMPWTHVQYIPEYHLAESKATSWSETESFLAHMWKETTFSKVIHWTKTEPLSVNQSTKDSIVTPWIQRGFPQEDIWVGYPAPKINQWIQEDSELESSVIVTLSSIVFTWTHPEHIPLVPWTESMELRYTTINKEVWPSYSPIILAHPESPEVFMPTNSVSETFTPLKWNHFPLKYHWAQPVPDKLIPLTRVLYIPESLWTEVIYSTFVHRTKFISSSEIIPIQPTYAIAPWAKDKISEIITCILSDYHACISWNQSMYVNSIVIETASSVVKNAPQAQSSLDFLAPTITTKFTTWKPSELPLLEAELMPIASTIVEWTQAEVSQNLIAETSKTTDTSLNSVTILPVQFYMQAETDKGTFLTVTESEAKKILTVSNINNLIISVHAPTYVIQHSAQIRQTSLLWTPTETLDRNTRSFSEEGSLLSWKVPIPLAASYELHHNPKHWFKTQDERIKPWTQSDFQIIDISTPPMTNKVEFRDVGMRSATGAFDAWTQSETENVRFWNISKDSTSRPWFQIETGIDNTQMPLTSTAVKVWPQTESEVFRPWTQNVFNIPLSQDEIEPETYSNMSDINAVLSWFQFQKISTRQRTKFARETVTPWIQQEWQIAHSWNEHEMKAPKTGSHFKTDMSQIFLTHSKSDELTLWTQPESQLVRRWTEDVVVTLWSLTKNDAIKPWLGLEYETAQPLAQLSDSVFDPSVQCEASTETLQVVSWIPFDAVPYSVQTQIESTFQSPTQIHTIRQWSQPEYETTKYLTHSNVGIAYPWVHHESSTETLEIIPWTRSDMVIPYPLKTKIDYAFQPLSQVYTIRQWSQPKYEITKYSTHPNVPNPNPWIQHEDSTKTQRIIPWTHSGMVISYPLQTQMGSVFQSSTQIYAVRQWSQPKYETTESWTQPDVGMAYPWIKHQGSTETLEIISWTPSNAVKSSLQTQIDSTLHYLPQNYAIGQWSQPDYKTTRSIQTNYGINPLIQPQGSTATLKMVFWTHPDTLISHPVQTLMDSFRFWNQFQPKTTQIWTHTAEQARETPVLTGIGTITPPFHFQETLSRMEPILMPPPQPDLQDKPLMEPLSFKESILNVSLSGCHLSMVWKDNLQALWLYKTAVLSHETTECGLRPGLVPHCPNCWEAEIGEFPWMVSVQLSYSHFCAGSILNEKWILTSARCANFVKRSEALALVQVGLVDLQDSTQGEIVGIHRSMPYLGSSGPLGPGLLFLKEPLQFQPWVLPICLVESPDQERHIQLYDCWLPSWSLMRGSPGILQKRHLSIMQISPCDKFWPQLNEFTFCVEAKKAMGESGCKGDLGAPLVCHLQHKDTWVQMGILIHFDEHCKKPYVFSHVSPFIFWLQRVTQPSHAPWSNQEPVTISVSKSLSVFTNRKLSKFTTSGESTPHFISLQQPQALGDHISLQYTMPWQALISSCGNQICSGSMINSYWVLTAAHCVRHMNPKDTVVILGFRNPGTTLKIVKVTAILLNEEFRLSNQGVRNDLALVRIQEGQGSVPIVAPLGNIRNLNTSECWLSGPQIVNPGDILENPEVLQIQLMGASSCAHLYPDIGGSTVCYSSQARGPEINMESVSPGSTVMCRPISGNGKWIQIGLTSLKHLATIVSPHFSWILSSTAKAGYPLNPDFNPWVENPRSSSLVRLPTTLLFYFGMTLAVMRMFIL